MSSQSQNSTSSTHSNKRRLQRSSDDEAVPSKISNKGSTNFVKFIVLTSQTDKPLTKISPFVIQKTIQSVAGDDQKVTKMKNGSLLVECQRQQQSENLLSLKTILETPIEATPHRTLNFCRGIVRDRDHDLSDMTEEDICNELKPQNITQVKRFTKKSEGRTVKLNTYLLTFGLSSVPNHIYIGPYRIKVDIYVPNPTRCFKCQKFGHGKSSCRGTEKCVKCSVEGHSSFECGGSVKCSNCGGDHMANSRVCEHYKKEFAIQKLKAEEKITYQEARKRLSVSDNAQPTSYADKVKGPPTTRSFETQTVFTWPNGSTLPILVSEFDTQNNPSSAKTSSTSSSSQTPSTSLAFNHFEMADIYANSEVERKMREHLSRGRRLNTSSNAATAKTNNQSTKQSTNAPTSKSSSSPKKDNKSQGNTRSKSSDKIQKKPNSDRKKKQKRLFIISMRYCRQRRSATTKQWIPLFGEIR